MKKYLVLLMAVFTAVAMSAASVTGRVLNEKGEPVAGATAQEVGNSKNKTTTNAAGVFTIKVKKGNSVAVVTEGYIKKSTKVAGKNMGDIYIFPVGTPRQNQKAPVAATATKSSTTSSAAKKSDPKAKEKAKAEARARNTTYHFLSMWGGGGYSGLLNKFGSQVAETSATNGFVGAFDPKFVGSGGGLIGLGYELHKKDFIFAIGPEFRFLGSADKLDFTYSEEMPAPGAGNFDAQNNPYYAYNAARLDYPTMTQHYNFYNTYESQAVGQVMLPITVGGQFADQRLYLLAGAKVGYTLFDFWNQRGRMTTSVSDDMAMDDWMNIPSHDLTTTTGTLANHPLFAGEAKGKNKFGLDVAVTAEFGFNINQWLSAEWNEKNEESKHPWRMRLGAFVDYGIPMMQADDRTQAFASFVPSADGATSAVITNSIMRAPWYANDKLSSLLVGVKFTALFQLNKPKIPNPRMQFVITDKFTGKAIPAAKVTVKQTGTKRKPQVKTMKRDGSLQQRYTKGDYDILPAGNIGYLDAPYYYNGEQQVAEVTYTLDKDLQDTIHFSLIPTPKLYGYIHDASSEQLINGSILFMSNSGRDTVTYSSVVDSKLIFAQLTYGDTYTVKVTSANYHDTVAQVTNLYDTVHYYLRPIKRIRRTLLLKHMYFATDHTEILEQSEQDLQTLYNFLVENPKIRILITGHTDSQGSDTYNQKLSEGRAASVKTEMVKRGIDADRMETNGKGESEPIDTNETEEGRQNNRRVQITVLNAEDATVDVY